MCCAPLETVVEHKMVIFGRLEERQVLWNVSLSHCNLTAFDCLAKQKNIHLI